MCMTEEVLLETVKSLEHVQLRLFWGMLIERLGLLHHSTTFFVLPRLNVILYVRSLRKPIHC